MNFFRHVFEYFRKDVYRNLVRDIRGKALIKASSIDNVIKQSIPAFSSTSYSSNVLGHGKLRDYSRVRLLLEQLLPFFMFARAFNLMMWNKARISC